MPRRASSRLRGATGAGSGVGVSDGETVNMRCPPLPPSPGKRKTRSPVDELQGGPAAPSGVRCMAFQSPKKKALGGGIVDRFNAPVDKENDLAGGSSGGRGTLVFGEGQSLLQGGGTGTFRLSACSAFSQTSKISMSVKDGVGSRRRNREDISTGAPPRAEASPRVVDLTKGSPLPFLLAPASLTSSPDLGNKTGSRRTRTNRLTRSRDSTTSSSTNSNGCASPTTAPTTMSSIEWSGNMEQQLSERNRTPRQRRGRSLSGAGCAAGGKRAASTSAASMESAASPPAPKGSSGSGGGPAGACRGDSGEYDSMSEADRSPLRSPVHRLTESLQKWAPGSRYSRAMASNEGDSNTHNCSSDGSFRAMHDTDAGASVSGAAHSIGASWSGQELRRTLDEERDELAGKRRPRSHTEEVICPHQSFRDSPAYSPISPASSVASINLANDTVASGELHSFSYAAGTPPSAGPSWPSSPTDAKHGGISGDCSGDGDSGGGPAGAVERFASSRMEESWSDDEDGDVPSGAVIRLAFSPRKERRGGHEADSAQLARLPVAMPSNRAWASPFSPVKESRSRPNSGLLGTVTRSASAKVEGARARMSSAGDSALEYSLGSPIPSRNGEAGNDPHTRDMPHSPEEHSLHSVRDLMDDGSDEEDGASGGRTGLVRRRRRRSRPELALRTLEMPDAGDLTIVEDAEATVAASTEAELTTGNVAVTDKTLDSLSSPVNPGVVGTAGGESGTRYPTTCPQWTCSDSTNGQLESIMDAQESTVTLDASWIGTSSREAKGKGNDSANVTVGKDWEQDHEQDQSSNGFGNSVEEAGQDLAGLSRDSGLASLGISGLSAADTSGTSDSSTTSFVKSRPIPDQAAFGTSRMGKGGAGAPLSPLGCSTGGGPAAGTGPLCITPRKSVMRCPPTPQRTPTWDGLEDSLLLEGAGSGGRGSARSSGRRSIRRMGRSGPGGSLDSCGFGDMAIDADLANVSGSRTASLLAAAAGLGSGGNDSTLGGREGGSSGCCSGRVGGAGGYAEDATPARRGRVGASGRGGRGRGAGRETSSVSGTGGGRGLSSTGTSEWSEASRHFGARGSGTRTDAEAGIGRSRGSGGNSGSTGGSTAADTALGFKQDFVQMGPIGEGGFSVVWKVRARGTGKWYAIKRSKREFRGRRDRDRCLLEARALQRLGEHPGVLHFERAWQEEGHFCLQTELCELGTLKDFLERLPSRREMPEASVWQVLHDVGQALRHVHETGLVHLDVKPANLLIGDEGGRLKLADFGMATTYGEGMEGVGDGQEGDTLYMAKELLSSTKRLPSADMFSLGLTVYEVATRMELPGDGEDWHTMRDGRACGLPSSRSQELGAVVRQLMHPDPERRPTAEALCTHPQIAVFGNPGHQRDDYVFSQARAWRAAEAAAMDHPSNGLRTPTGDMSARYVFQQSG